MYGNVSDRNCRFLVRLRKAPGSLKERQVFNRNHGPLYFATDFPDFVNNPH